MSSVRSRRQSGQALVEFVLVIPILVLLMLGTIDLSRAYYMNVEIYGASRAGARAAIQAPAMDIGNFIRSEPNSTIKNDVATWGSTGPGQAYDKCASGGACGDPSGCASFAQQACWAVRDCILSPGPDVGSCSSYGAWGTVPNGSSHGVEILVVYKYQAITPMIQGIVGSGGLIYLKAATYADEVYY